MASSLDTTILVRYCTGDIAQQVAAVNKLFAESSQLSVADAAIIETEHVLRSLYTFGRADIVMTLEGLLSQSNLNCNKIMFKPALEQYAKHPALSFVDCCLAEYAKLNKMTPLLTFDRKLANQSPNAKLLPTS